MTFKDFFYKEINQFCEEIASPEYEIFFESPLFTGSYGGKIDNPAFNKIRVDSILANDKFLEKIIINGLTLNVYLGKSNNDLIEYSFLNEENDFLTCFAYMKNTEDDGMESNSIWNSYETKGLYFNLFFDYFLPKTKYIQSSDNNTKLASDFWVKAVKVALDKNLRCVIFDANTNQEFNINSSQFLVDNYKDIWNNFSHHKRIRIYNVKKLEH